MTAFDLFVCSLAVWEAIELWRHGSIFAGWRHWLETAYPFGFFAELLTCPFCLSVWTAAAVVAIQWAWAWPNYALAIARLANLWNDLTYPVCRSPGRDDLEDDDAGHAQTGPVDPETGQ